jgi:hypothetical protein
LTNHSCSTRNIVLYCDYYFIAFFQSIRVCQPFWEAVTLTPSVYKLKNIQAFDERISECALLTSHLGTIFKFMHFNDLAYGPDRWLPNSVSMYDAEDGVTV